MPASISSARCSPSGWDLGAHWKPLALVALSGTDDYPVKEIAEAITLRLAELLMLTVEKVLGFRATLQSDEPRLSYPVVAQLVNPSPSSRSG